MAHIKWKNEREQWRKDSGNLNFKNDSGNSLEILLEETSKRASALQLAELGLKGRAATLAGIFGAMALGVIGFVAAQDTLAVKGISGPATLVVAGLLVTVLVLFLAANPTYGVEPGVLPEDYKAESEDELRRVILKAYVKDMARSIEVQEKRIQKVRIGLIMGFVTIAMSGIWLLIDFPC